MKSAIPENLREFSIFVLFLLVVTYLVGISALITWVSVAYQNFSTGVDAVQQVRILQVGSVAIFAAIGLPFAAYRTFIADQEKEISRDEAEVSKRKQANEVILTASKLMADEIDGHMRKFRVSAGMLTMMKEANVELSYHNHVLGILAAGVPNRDEHSDTPQARFYFESLSEALALRTSKQSDFEIEQQHQIDLSRKSIRDFNLKRIPPLFSLVLDQSKVSDCLWEDLVISKMNATGSKIESCQFERLKINRLDLSGGADISNTKFFDCKFKWASFGLPIFPWIPLNKHSCSINALSKTSIFRVPTYLAMILKIPRLKMAFS